MNSYGIYSWFGYLLPLKERFRLIKEAGFDCVILWWGNELYELDGEKTKHPELARSHGLIVENVHAPYQFSNDLWDDGLNGEAYEKSIANCIKDCAACEISTLVMHVTDGLNPPKPGNTGIQRLNRLLETAGHHSVTLAIENVQNPEYLDVVFSQIRSDYLGFCYDSGHEFAVSGRLTLLQKYGYLLKAVHLHDNNGQEDQHLLPGEGRIDWAELASQISVTGYKGPATLESCAPWNENMGENDRESPESYLKRAFQKAQKISYMISPTTVTGSES